MAPLRIIFMGTPEFAVPTLAALHAAHQIVQVYTQPPRPAGRGYTLTPSPVQKFAEAHGLPVSYPVTLKDPAAQHAFASHQADLAVVAAYGLLLPQVILDAPRLGCINIHASLLPRWRGAAPIQRAILAGDQETGVCIMRMEAGLDSGPVYARASLPIDEMTTATELHDALATLGAVTLLEVLQGVAMQTVQAFVQSLEGVTYAHRLTRDEGRINWALPAEQLGRMVRALTPWPGVWCMWRGERLKILAATPHMSDRGNEHSLLAPGTIVDSSLSVQSGQGILQLQQVQLAGGKALHADEFINGHRVLPGESFQ